MLLDFLKRIRITSIKSFKFSYTQGYAMNADIRYELEYKDNNYFATIKKWGVPIEEAIIVEVNKSFEEKIEELLIKYKVASWDGFSKSNKHVLDGNSFSLSIRMEEDNSISAMGYMKWPKNYKEFREAIINLYNELIKE